MQGASNRRQRKITSQNCSARKASQEPSFLYTDAQGRSRVGESPRNPLPQNDRSECRAAICWEGRRALRHRLIS